MSRTALFCVGAASHAPIVLEVDRHHVYPKFLCAALGLPELTPTVLLCSGCHDRVHHFIRHYVNQGDLAGHRPSVGERILLNRFGSWWSAALLANR